MARRTVKSLIKEASALTDSGDTDSALAKYFEALEIDINHAAVRYDIGLIYKYRGAWNESFRYNRRAAELQPEDQASQWNLAIAATALRDWKTARAVWRGQGMKIEGSTAPMSSKRWWTHRSR